MSHELDDFVRLQKSAGALVIAAKTSEATHWHGSGHERGYVLDHEQIKDDLDDFHFQLIVRRTELLDEEAEGVRRHFLLSKSDIPMQCSGRLAHRIDHAT